MLKLSLLALVLSFTAACGAPANDPSGIPPSADAGATEQASDQQRDDFMRQCAQEEDQKAFCSCSFDVAKETLTPEELGQTELAPERAKLLQSGIARKCSDKLPIGKVKEGFMIGCTRPGPALQGFCECTWDAIQKAATVSEITQMQQDDPRIGESAKPCLSKIPEAELEPVLKKSFFQGCMKSAEAEKFCECAWKAVRKEVPIQNMLLGGKKWAEPALPKVRAECGKLAPKN